MEDTLDNFLDVLAAITDLEIQVVKAESNALTFRPAEALAARVSEGPIRVVKEEKSFVAYFESKEDPLLRRRVKPHCLGSTVVRAAQTLAHALQWAPELDLPKLAGSVTRLLEGLQHIYKCALDESSMAESDCLDSTISRLEELMDEAHVAAHEVSKI